MVIWSLVSGLIHVLWEGAWVVAAPYLQTPAALHDWRLYWTLYGFADHRYLHADPFLRVLELVTATVVAALNFWAAYQLSRRRNAASAMAALLVASVMEVYGTVLYFGSELFNHWADVDTTSFVHMWIMFVGLNALWVVIPGWCIYEILVYQLGSRRTAPRTWGAPLPAAELSR
ncbi:MAG: emopamil binding protein [Myxococcales bacterium]|nr:emopamil binding protein [Myxococcales bacterium]